MKKILLLIATTFICSTIFAGTPTHEVYKSIQGKTYDVYKTDKGAKYIWVKLKDGSYNKVFI